MPKRIVVKERSRIVRDGNENKYRHTARQREWGKEDRAEQKETMLQVVLWLGGAAVFLTIAMFVGLAIRG